MICRPLAGQELPRVPGNPPADATRSLTRRRLSCSRSTKHFPIPPCNSRCLLCAGGRCPLMRSISDVTALIIPLAPLPERPDNAQPAISQRAESAYLAVPLLELVKEVTACPARFA